jgi:hypothetical protein
VGPIVHGGQLLSPYYPGSGGISFKNRDGFCPVSLFFGKAPQKIAAKLPANCQESMQSVPAFLFLSSKSNKTEKFMQGKFSLVG